MREMLTVTAACRRGSRRVGRPVDHGRFSGATRGLMTGDVSPEGALGGPIAAVARATPSTSTSTSACWRSKSATPHCASAWRSGRRHSRGILAGVFAKYAALVSTGIGRRDHPAQVASDCLCCRSCVDAGDLARVRVEGKVKSRGRGRPRPHYSCGPLLDCVVQKVFQPRTGQGHTLFGQFSGGGAVGHRGGKRPVARTGGPGVT